MQENDSQTFNYKYIIWCEIPDYVWNPSKWSKAEEDTMQMFCTTNAVTTYGQETNHSYNLAMKNEEISTSIIGALKFYSHLYFDGEEVLCIRS